MRRHQHPGSPRSLCSVLEIGRCGHVADQDLAHAQTACTKQGHWPLSMHLAHLGITQSLPSVYTPSPLGSVAALKEIDPCMRYFKRAERSSAKPGESSPITIDATDIGQEAKRSTGGFEDAARLGQADLSRHTLASCLPDTGWEHLAPLGGFRRTDNRMGP